MKASDLEGSDGSAAKSSWSYSVTDRMERSMRWAWAAAIIAATIALLEAIALVMLTPLKTVEPYTLLVDRQTGNVEALQPLETQDVSPDSALTRSFLVQYVITREGFDVDNIQSDYRKVFLWSDSKVRQRYSSQIQKKNPASPLAYMPRGGTIQTEIRSIASLSPKSSLVRFSTIRSDLGGRSHPPQYWAAVINFQFSNAEMSEADRLINPLGFQVTRYRRNAETLAEVDPAPSPAPVRQVVRPVVVAE